MHESAYLLFLYFIQMEKLCEVLAVTCNQTQLWNLDVYKQAWQIIYQKSSHHKDYKTAMIR